ncbi:hypothetical protein ON010_g4930 [Phytophthora cinnamomi]|nr:hypothetical protein ON010_g4930 [Phytophthora cinnamomi]
MIDGVATSEAVSTVGVGTKKYEDEITEAVEAMVARALDEGFPSDRVERLRIVIYMYGIWRVKLGDDPPAKVLPLKIRLKPGAKPYKAEARKYPPELQRFLEDFNDTLVSLGWVYENPEARWACPSLPVKKAGSTNEYRQTTDYKPMNVQVEPIVGTMPNLDVDLERVAVASQEILSYMTHRKNYTPRRVPQGCSDAALHFQATMERCFASLLYKHLLVWIDDLLLYAKTVDEYLDKLEELFTLVDNFGFKLSATKSCVYKKQVKWCGKLIDGDGVRHDPARIEALGSLPHPSTAGQLQQFICSTNWMRASIIDYGRLVRPLQEKLDSVMANASRRTKRVASGIPITLSSVELRAFDQMKDALSRAATLAFPKPEAETILITDASDVGWSVIVTQVANWQARTPIHEQEHELFTIEHIEGVKNVWADMISRWAGCKLSLGTSIKRLRRKRGRAKDSEVKENNDANNEVHRPSTATIRPFSGEGFEWPDLAAIFKSQRQHSATRLSGLTKNSDDVWVKDDCVWIPAEDSEIMYRLLVVAH